MQPSETPILPPHPVMQIQNVELEALEAAVYSRDYEQATTLLLEALRRLRTGAVFVGYRTDWDILTVLYTRFCSAVVSLMADPQYFLSEEGLQRLSAEHQAMDLVFRASAYTTSDHLLPQVTQNPSETDAKAVKFRDPGALLKYLLTYSLRSLFALNFEETFRRAPSLLFPLYLGMLGHLLTSHKLAQERTEQLVGLHAIFRDVPLPDSSLPALTDAYMYSSYSTRADRHELKKTLIHVLARMMQERVPNLPTDSELARRRRNRPKRPTMVIPLDWFTSLHAMYRCWAPAVRQLRQDFRLVAISQAMAVDEESKKEFDQWIEVPSDHVAFDTLVASVMSAKPDVIYYPAIGMSPWFVALASVRLAPVQMMTLGHPATSGSAEIDYVLGDAGTFSDPALFTERIVELPAGSLFNFVMRPDAVFPPQQEKEEAPSVVRVAVPAMMCKLNAKFMAACQRIQQNAKTPTEFHLFPNMVGLTMQQASRELREWLPGAVVYERMDYNTYIRFLQTCDVHLSTFPFGGTNSNIDSMKLGLPLVCLEGAEPFERFDATMLRKAGMPEWCIAQSEDEYVAAAVKMIDDHATRTALREQLLATDLDAAFFKTDETRAFGRAVKKLYDEHETLRGERWVKL